MIGDHDRRVMADYLTLLRDGVCVWPHEWQNELQGADRASVLGWVAQLRALAEPDALPVDLHYAYRYDVLGAEEHLRFYPIAKLRRPDGTRYWTRSTYPPTQDSEAVKRQLVEVEWAAWADRFTRIRVTHWEEQRRHLPRFEYGHRSSAASGFLSGQPRHAPHARRR